MGGKKRELGQGSVEAAVVIPVMFILLLLLIQPGIILYDRLVMGDAAAQGCRLLATANSSMTGSCEAFVRHRLAAIPQQDCFHVHDEKCSWNIELIGDESSSEVSVRIGNEVKPLPLFDAASTLLGMTNGQGNLVITEEITLPAQPGWVASAPAGSSPSGWTGAWLS